MANRRTRPKLAHPETPEGIEVTVENEAEDTDELESIPPVPRGGPAAKQGAKPGKKGTASQKDGDRNKRELITIGKAKGFLTYDEVSQRVPEGAVPTDQMDDWLSAFADEGIEIIEAPAKGKAAPDDDADEDEEAEVEAKVEAKEEEDADGSAGTGDPVRMYMRKMGTISLLTREGEVEIAKRIEDGDRRVLKVVLNSSVAIEEILGLGDKLRKQEIRVKEVVRDVDEEDPEFDQAVAHRARLQGDREGPPAVESGRGDQQEEAGDPGGAPGDAPQQEADRPDRPQAEGVRLARRAGPSRGRRPASTSRGCR